jgi:Skp family chaperone for outer membrane proteins
MKKLLLALSATVAMGFCASAQDANEVDIETSDVQLEMITPAQPVQETEQEIKEREKKLREMNDEVA